MFCLPNSCSLASAPQCPLQLWHLVSFWESSALLKEQEAGERIDRKRSAKLKVLGEKQHDLGSMVLFVWSLRRDPVVSHKIFGVTVRMLLWQNLGNSKTIPIINKRSLLCALNTPCKVYSVNNYMLFCSLKKMKWLEFLIQFLRFPVRCRLSAKFKAPFVSNCFQYFFILLASFNKALAVCFP